jgi:hypothetical protein
MLLFGAGFALAEASKVQIKHVSNVRKNKTDSN